MAAKWLTALACGTVLVIGGTAVARQRGAAIPLAGPTLTTQDYIDIQQLVARYAFALNTGANNGFDYADLFVPDGIFRGRLVPFSQGREQLAALARSPRFGPLFVWHYTSNHVIEPSPEGATGKQYLVVIDIGEEGKPSGVNQGGHFDDVYARTANGWRFRSRTYTPSQAGQSSAAGSEQPRQRRQ